MNKILRRRFTWFLAFLNERGNSLCLAFLLCLKGTRALAYQNNYKFSIVLYILKIIMALSIIAVTVFLFYRYAMRKGLFKKSDELQLIALLPLGNDKVYLIRCKDQVICVFAGKSGVMPLGKWSLNDWNENKKFV